MKKRLTLVLSVILVITLIASGFVFATEKTVHPDGFDTENGETVYYLDGEKVTGFQDINGDRYYFFPKTGYMAKGLQDIGKYTYYFLKQSGRMYKGFKTIDGYKYFFSVNSGHMLKGFQTIDGYRYYFSKNTGHMLKGFQTIGKYRYYFSKETGHMLKGFQDLGKYRYYFSVNTGHMLKGFQTIDGDRYYFSKSTGHMLKGFQTIGENRYYFFKDSGIMAKGLQDIGKYKYYFLKQSGRMYKGIKAIDGDKYYFSTKNGHMLKGFRTIEGSRYFFDRTTGKMVFGVNKIGNNVYTFNSDGVLVRTVYGDKKAICLTWDDGPSANTRTIMDALKQNGGLGTFFVVGNRVDAYSQTLKDNYAMGNQIGNHSWSHPDMTSMDGEDIKKQVNDTSSKIKSVIGKKPTIMRTPYGISNQNVRDNISLPIILWSVDTLDWKTQNADSTYNSIMSHAKDGAVVLMHDLYVPTANAAVRAIPDLVNKGYQLVTVEEMALLKGVKLKKGNVYGNF